MLRLFLISVLKYCCITTKKNESNNYVSSYQIYFVSLNCLIFIALYYKIDTFQPSVLFRLFRGAPHAPSFVLSTCSPSVGFLCSTNNLNCIPQYRISSFFCFSVMKVYNRVCFVFLSSFIALCSEQLLSGMDLCKCFIYLITHSYCFW